MKKKHQTINKKLQVEDYTTTDTDDVIPSKVILRLILPITYRLERFIETDSENSSDVVDTAVSSRLAKKRKNEPFVQIFVPPKRSEHKSPPPTKSREQPIKPVGKSKNNPVITTDAWTGMFKHQKCFLFSSLLSDVEELPDRFADVHYKLIKKSQFYDIVDRLKMEKKLEHEAKINKLKGETTDHRLKNTRIV